MKNEQIYRLYLALILFTEIQRKPLTDIFEQESQLIHPEAKMPSLDTAALNAKWKAAQAARYLLKLNLKKH